MPKGAVKYALIEKMRTEYSVPFLCKMFGVSKSGYYKWSKHIVSDRAKNNEVLKLHILSAHKRTRGTYWMERLHRELISHNIFVSKWKILMIRKEVGIMCKQRGFYRNTTKAADYRINNLLCRNFRVNEPNRVWLSDITYIPTSEGWLYLASHKELFNGEIVGYAFSDKMTVDLVKRSLLKGISHRKPPFGLIHHSDRGSQYTSHEYKELLSNLCIRQSIGGKGDCYDNAPMESFWSTLKNQLVSHRKYRSRQEAIMEITEYIELFYNKQRIQANLDYLSPIGYLTKYYEKLKCGVA